MHKTFWLLEHKFEGFFWACICIREALDRRLTLPAGPEICLSCQKNPRHSIQCRQAVTASGGKGNGINQSDTVYVLTVLSHRRLALLSSCGNGWLHGCSCHPCACPWCLLQLLSPVLPSKRRGQKVNPQLRLLAPGPLWPNNLSLELGFLCWFTILKYSISFSSYKSFSVSSTFQIKA